MSESLDASNRGAANPWEFVPLSELADIAGGTAFPEPYQGNAHLEYPFIKVSDMNRSSDDVVINGAANTVDESILSALGARTCPAGTVVFPKVGGALLTNKRRILGQRAAFDNNVLGVVPRCVDGRYLYHWLCTLDFGQIANSQALPSIRKRDVAALRVPVPPLPEQQRIAALLDEAMAHVQEARAAAQARLAAIEALPAALLQSVFPAPGAPLPEGWRWVRLGDVIRDAQGGFACGARDQGGIAQLRMNNVDTSGNLLLDDLVRVPPDGIDIERYLLKAGDLLFNNTNSTELVGKSALFQGHSEPLVYSNHFTRLRTIPDLTLPGFVSRWLNWQWCAGVFAAICNRWVGQSAVKPAVLMDLSLPLPPLPEQQCIAALLDDAMARVQAARSAAQAELDAIAALPAALLRRAFSGGW